MAIVEPVAFGADNSIKNMKLAGNKWTQISVETFKKDLAARVLNPLPNQKSKNFCGPAAIMYVLLQVDVDKFVGLMKDLFETGEFQPQKTKKPCDKKFHAGSNLLQFAVPTDMNAVDWMFMATIRDDANLLFDYESNIGSMILDPVAGMTTPWEMVDWTGDLLGAKSWYYSTIAYGEEDGLKQADAIASGGGFTFIMCNPSLFSSDINYVDALDLVPTHWVVFTEGGDPLIFNAGGASDTVYKLTVFSWGEMWKFSRVAEAFEDAVLGVRVCRVCLIIQPILRFFSGAPSLRGTFQR